MFVTAHARLGDPLSALQLLREMKGQGIRPSLLTLTAAMDGCLRAGDASLALSVSSEMVRAQIPLDEVRTNGCAPIEENT